MEIYHDFYGCVACIRHYKNGTARLTVRTAGGHLVHRKDYATYRGAKIAMGKLTDGGWTRK